MTKCAYVSKTGKECDNKNLFSTYPVCKRHAKLKTVQVTYGIEPESIRDEDIEVAIEEAEEEVRKDERTKIQKKKIEKEREEAVQNHPLNIDVTDLEPGEKKKKKKAKEEPEPEDEPGYAATKSEDPPKKEKKSPKKKSRFIDTEALNQLDVPDVPEKGLRPSKAKRMIDAGFNSILAGGEEPEVPRKTTKIAPNLPKDKRKPLHNSEESKLESEELEEEEFEEGDFDDEDEEESSGKVKSKGSFSRGMLLIGYKVALGIAETYGGPHLSGFSNTTFSIPGLAEVIDECNDELHEMLGLDDMDCWTKLMMITCMGGMVTYTKNKAIGSGAPMPSMVAPQPVPAARAPVAVSVQEIQVPVPADIQIPEGHEDL